MADDDIIEGSAVVVHEEQPKKPTHRIQVTVKPQTDHGLKQVANEQIEGYFDRETAWAVLVHYLMQRKLRAEVTNIIQALLMGKKPKYERRGNKFSFTFYNERGQEEETYHLFMLEL